MKTRELGGVPGWILGTLGCQLDVLVLSFGVGFEGVVL
jgi:hypothetical protein